MRLNMLMPGNRQINLNTAEPGSGTANESAAAGSESDQETTNATETATAPDYSWVPDAYKGDNGPDTAKFVEDFDSYAAAKAQLDERLANVPEGPDGYDFTLADDLKFDGIEGLPEGFKVESLAEQEAFKPLFQELGSVLHKHGIPGEAAKDINGLLARYEATKVAEGVKAGKAELEKLPNWQSRIATVERAVASKLDAAQAAALKSAITTADGLKALEKLLSPGGPKTSTPHPATSGLDQITDPSARLRAARVAGR